MMDGARIFDLEQLRTEGMPIHLAVAVTGGSYLGRTEGSSDRDSQSEASKDFEV